MVYRQDVDGPLHEALPDCGEFISASFRLFDPVQLIGHPQGEVFRPARGGDHAVSHGFAQFFWCGAGLLRDREVFAQSVRAVNGDGTGDADQFAGFGVQNFLIGKIEKFTLLFHLALPYLNSGNRSAARQNTPTGAYFPLYHFIVALDSGIIMITFHEGMPPHLAGLRRLSPMVACDR